jgi:hypothetical protein
MDRGGAMFTTRPKPLEGTHAFRAFAEKRAPNFCIAQPNTARNSFWRLAPFTVG